MSALFYTVRFGKKNTGLVNLEVICSFRKFRKRNLLDFHFLGKQNFENSYFFYTLQDQFAKVNKAKQIIRAKYRTLAGKNTILELQFLFPILHTYTCLGALAVN